MKMAEAKEHVLDEIIEAARLCQDSHQFGEIVASILKDNNQIHQAVYDNLCVK